MSRSFNESRRFHEKKHVISRQQADRLALREHAVEETQRLADEAELEARYLAEIDEEFYPSIHDLDDDHNEHELFFDDPQDSYYEPYYEGYYDVASCYDDDYDDCVWHA